MSKTSGSKLAPSPKSQPQMKKKKKKLLTDLRILNAQFCCREAKKKQTETKNYLQPCT